jgi:hypothetical protein
MGWLILCLVFLTSCAIDSQIETTCSVSGDNVVMECKRTERLRAIEGPVP